MLIISLNYKIFKNICTINLDIYFNDLYNFYKQYLNIRKEKAILEKILQEITYNEDFYAFRRRSVMFELFLKKF